MRKHLIGSVALLMVVSMVLGACTSEATPEPSPIPPTPTTAPEVTDEPSGPPDLTGETITLYHFGDLSGHMPPSLPLLFMAQRTQWPP
jgi:hypothetical protein